MSVSRWRYSDSGISVQTAGRRVSRKAASYERRVRLAGNGGVAGWLVLACRGGGANLSSMEAGGWERAAWAATPSPPKTRKATSSSSKCADSVKESSAASSVARVRCCSAEHAAVDTTCTRAAFSPGGHSCSAHNAWRSDPAACRCGDSPKSIRRWSSCLRWSSLALIAARSNESESPAKWSESSTTRGLFITCSSRTSISSRHCLAHAAPLPPCSQICGGGQG